MGSVNVSQVAFNSSKELRPHPDDGVGERISRQISNIK